MMLGVIRGSRNGTALLSKILPFISVRGDFDHDVDIFKIARHVFDILGILFRICQYVLRLEHDRGAVVSLVFNKITVSFDCL